MRSWLRRTGRMLRPGSPARYGVGVQVLPGEVGKERRLHAPGRESDSVISLCLLSLVTEELEQGGRWLHGAAADQQDGGH